MKPIDIFLQKPKSFWASVRSMSQQCGYSKNGKITVPSIEKMEAAFRKLELDPANIINNGKPTPLAKDLISYFQARADYLNKYVEPKLMTADQAKALFDEVRAKVNPTYRFPMNKQKGAKKAEAYLTCLVNMMIEHHCSGMDCNYDPRELTTITKNGVPVRTLARRVDGAFPSAVNPVALWEIKEYYYTTTFGSRVADGVYETLLDGMELEELRQNEGIKVKHYLFVDAHYTWWECGKSYLCRMFDMVHMGICDEILFGREVVEEMPRIVDEWVTLVRNREAII